MNLDEEIPCPSGQAGKKHSPVDPDGRTENQRSINSFSFLIKLINFMFQYLNGFLEIALSFSGHITLIQCCGNVLYSLL